MISVVQRVSQARIRVAGQTVGEIGPGLLVLVCAEQGDAEAQADKLLASCSSCASSATPRAR